MARSKLEALLDKALAELYPHERIRSDWAIKIPPGRTLYVDRIIPGARVAVEADGRQHSTFIKYMHGDADGFRSHQERDRIKAEWLAANGYTLVRVAYNETISAGMIREKILAALTAEEE
jgi:very-short-patch-repair endonuclease